MLFIILAILSLPLISGVIYLVFTKLLPAKKLTLKHAIGQTAKTLTPIGPTPFDTGSIRFKGDVFPAVTQEHMYIPKGSTVVIVSFEGIRVIVKTLK